MADSRILKDRYWQYVRNIMLEVNTSLKYVSVFIVIGLFVLRLMAYTK